ncbi:PilN domain-containing protein [Ferrimonas balearica]|uniref:PilN domain-containing protein n=1 Tax=Ferrimonas balearica TaxID=44012 RepID=UPI001C99AF53|nr:PilN domain-containing protein [Ferrimonas balearica]MBY5993140.1 PilN domain-containing protein [Ferrimonas balearica]
MKRSVNLYSPALLPDKARLTLPRLLKAVAAVLVLALALAGQLHRSGDALSAQWDQARAEEQALSAELAQLAQQVRAHQPRPELVAAVEQAEARLAAYQRLAQVLDRDALLTQPGFSNLMTDLANSSDNQVWLERFQLAQSSVLLRGQAQRAAAVPAWLDRLGQQPSLQGRSLSQLSIQGEAGKPVHFVAGHGLADEEGQP